MGLWLNVQYSMAHVLALVGWNLWRLLRDYRRRVAGSRLSARLSVLFMVLALVPVSVVYFYSIRFLSSGIDSWFEVEIDEAWAALAKAEKR